MVEDDDLRRTLLRLQFDPELVFQGFQKTRPGRIRLRGGTSRLSASLGEPPPSRQALTDTTSNSGRAYKRDGQLTSTIKLRDQQKTVAL
jgi:hypothetical protein